MGEDFVIRPPERTRARHVGKNVGHPADVTCSSEFSGGQGGHDWPASEHAWAAVRHAEPDAAPDDAHASAAEEAEEEEPDAA